MKDKKFEFGIFKALYFGGKQVADLLTLIKKIKREIIMAATRSRKSKSQDNRSSKRGKSVSPENRSSSKDRDLASEAGRKGGQRSHDND